VYYASVTKRDTQSTVSKRTYFMAVIDGVFCLDVHVIYKEGTLSVVMHA